MPGEPSVPNVNGETETMEKYGRESHETSGLGIACAGASSLALDLRGTSIHSGTLSCAGTKRNKTMKKLMIAASAALLATVGLCIESANVVGYQNENMGSKRSIFLNTFTSTSGAGMTIGDITANSFNDEDGDYDVWDWTGFTPFADFIQTMNKNGQFTGQYTYAPAGYAGGNEAGWFDFADKTCTTPRNSVSIPFGSGFYLNAGDGAGGLTPELTFAGQVKADATVIPVASSRMLTGNASPVDITLGQITANSFNDEDGDYGVWDWTGFTPFNDFIQVMNDSGKFIGKYTYAPAGYAGGNEAGWYEDSDTGCTKCMNSVVIKAGQAFLVVAGDGAGGLAPTITIPSAL